MKRYSKTTLIIACVLIYTISLSLSTRCREDIPLEETHRAYDMMADLAREGLAPGYEEYNFSVDRDMTRDEMAEAVAASTDHYYNRPGEFDESAFRLLSELRTEFRQELESIGDARRLSRRERAPAVPPGNWTYRALSMFAEAGIPPGIDPTRYSGAEIITREEAAATVMEIAQYHTHNPDVLDQRMLTLLDYLEEDYRAEIARLSREKDKPEPAAMPRAGRPAAGGLSVSGSSNLNVAARKGEKSSVSNRMSVNVEGRSLKSYFSGDVDNSDREGEDIALGGSYSFQVNRRLIEYHSSMELPAGDRFIMAGDINNLDFARGLVTGAANIKGVMASVPAVSPGRFTAVWGEDGDDHQYLMSRYRRELGEGVSFGISSAREASAGVSRKITGADFSTRILSGRFAAEYASAAPGGNGLFLSYDGFPRDSLRLVAEYRRYRDFRVDNNNPPSYLGRSGGDEENQRSFYSAVEWTVRDGLDMLLSRDHIYDARGRRNNVFIGARLDPVQDTTLYISREKESGNTAPDIEKSIKLKYTGFDGIELSLDRDRALLPNGATLTSRIGCSLYTTRGKLLWTHTIRSSYRAGSRVSRLRYSRRIFTGATASVSYTYSQTEDRRFNTSLSWRF